VVQKERLQEGIKFQEGEVTWFLKCCVACAGFLSRVVTNAYYRYYRASTSQ
jgi:hypothetical protein